MGLRFVAVDDGTVEGWRLVHNLVVPTAVIAAEDMPRRVERNHLEVAYDGETLVGCSTVRPPVDDARTATVIVRVLPGYRRRGFGAEFYERELGHAYDMGAARIETVVLESGEDGLRFAFKHGFTEVERYLLPGDSVRFVDLRLTGAGPGLT